jgi:hypothetical protein
MEGEGEGLRVGEVASRKVPKSVTYYLNILLMRLTRYFQQDETLNKIKNGVAYVSTKQREIGTQNQGLQDDQVSISSTFYVQLLRTQIPNAQKDSQVSSVVWCVWDLQV